MIRINIRHIKLPGLVGGISWVSTIEYYRYINQAVNKRLGGNEYADCIIYSLNYGEIIRYNEAKDLENTFNIILKASIHLKNSGAKAIVISEQKYGTYYLNISGIIEHIHYHLGQIVIIKKLILANES